MLPTTAKTFEMKSNKICSYDFVKDLRKCRLFIKVKVIMMLINKLAKVDATAEKAFRWFLPVTGCFF